MTFYYGLPRSSTRPIPAFWIWQKAEEQAWQARIESGLERVRAKAMAMHSSDDLIDTSSVLIHELNSLNIHPARLGFAEIIPERKAGIIFTTQVEGQKENLRIMADITLEGNDIFESIYEHWLNEKEYLPVLKGKVMTNYYNELNKYVTVQPPPKEPSNMVYSCFTKM